MQHVKRGQVRKRRSVCGANMCDTLLYSSVPPLSLSADSESIRSGTGTDSNRVPTVDKIKELEMNNIYWTAEQLDQMSSETFAATVDTLGKIPDFSTDQLDVLSSKAMKVRWRHRSWFCLFRERF